MNIKILALAFVSTVFFFNCTADDNYSGKFCFAQVFEEGKTEGKQIGIICQPIDDNIMTETTCHSSGIHGKIVYSCKKLFCYSKIKGHTFCEEIGDIITESACYNDSLINSQVNGQVVHSCPKDPKD